MLDKKAADRLWWATIHKVRHRAHRHSISAKQSIAENHRNARPIPVPTLPKLKFMGGTDGRDSKGRS